MLCWYALIASNPAYSPDAPEFGCTLTASKPVILHKSAFSDAIISTYPSVCARGAKGWTSENSGHVTGIISAVALSFMVQEPMRETV